MCLVLVLVLCVWLVLRRASTSWFLCGSWSRCPRRGVQCMLCSACGVQCMLCCVYCTVCTAHAVRRCAVVQSYCHAVLSAVLCLLCGADVQCVLRRVLQCVVLWCAAAVVVGRGPVWYPGSCVVACPVVWWVRPVCGCPGCGAAPPRWWHAGACVWGWGWLVGVGCVVPPCPGGGVGGVL